MQPLYKMLHSGYRFFFFFFILLNQVLLSETYNLGEFHTIWNSEIDLVFYLTYSFLGRFGKKLGLSLLEFGYFHTQVELGLSLLELGYFHTQVELGLSLLELGYFHTQVELGLSLLELGYFHTQVELVPPFLLSLKVPKNLDKLFLNSCSVSGAGTVSTI